MAIVGSREWRDPDAVAELIDQLLDGLPIGVSVISGGARGVDAWVRETCERHGISFDECPAEWATYGRSAGCRRNAEMVARADQVVAIWNGRSAGTKHSIDLALREQRRLEVIFPERRP